MPSPWGEGAQCAHWADEGTITGKSTEDRPPHQSLRDSFPPRGSLLKPRKGLNFFLKQLIKQRHSSAVAHHAHNGADAKA